MTDTLWSFTPLAGLAIAFMSNVLRARRTEDLSCLGHLFVASDRLTTTELVLNRGGIAVFFVGLVGALLT